MYLSLVFVRKLECGITNLKFAIFDLFSTSTIIDFFPFEVFMIFSLTYQHRNNLKGPVTRYRYLFSQLAFV